MIIEAISVGPMQANCYVLAEGTHQKAIVIDPGDEARKIKKLLAKSFLEAAFIINTHGHYDHIGADNEFSVPVFAHRDDVVFLQNPHVNLSGVFALPFRVTATIEPLTDKQIITLGMIQLEVLHIPGHTPGGIALLMKQPHNNVVFTGDTLFYQGIGRSDLPGGDGDVLIKGIREKLLCLSDGTVVYPGHGVSTTIGDEKRHNEFLR